MTPCTARYVYTLSEARLSAEFTYAEGTERGEGGENPASDFSANDINKVWYRSNLTGSSLYAVDKNGETVSHAVYNAWGKLQSDAPTDMNFTGMEGLISYSTYSWDVTLELYFAQNRFYDPADKRFTQEDKTEDGVNWYLYVENNPLIFIDADGNMMVPAEGCGSRASKPRTRQTPPPNNPPASKAKTPPKTNRLPDPKTKSGSRYWEAKREQIYGNDAVSGGKAYVPKPAENKTKSSAQKNQQRSNAALSKKKHDDQKMHDLLQKQQEELGCKLKSPFADYDPNNPLELPLSDRVALYSQPGTEIPIDILERDPELAKALGIKTPAQIIREAEEDALSKIIPGTHEMGWSVSGAAGLAGTASLGIAIDRKGDVGFVWTTGKGVGGWGIGISSYQTYTNAPHLSDLEGDGMVIGGSIGIEGVSVGLDYSEFESTTGKKYNGVTLSGGFSFSLGGDAHIYSTDTEVIPLFNVLDLLPQLVR